MNYTPVSDQLSQVYLLKHLQQSQLRLLDENADVFVERLAALQ